MGEISTASREQSTAVEQVSRAVVDMDQTTQVNRLLVTDSAQAAHSLQQQAEALAAAMAVFRLDSQADAPHVPAPAALPAAHAARAPGPAF